MLPHIVNAHHVHEYIIWIRFNDGKEGEIDLKEELWGEVFEPLQDIEQFKKFCVDPELRTIVWQNGADLAPEFLYENVRELSEVQN